MLREEGSSLVHFERYSPSMEENTMACVAAGVCSGAPHISVGLGAEI